MVCFSRPSIIFPLDLDEESKSIICLLDFREERKSLEAVLRHIHLHPLRLIEG